MASKKFRNLNVEFRDIMGLSVSQRLDMLRSEAGQGILAGFTPAQLVDMFPRYYSERLPSVGKSLSRVSGGKVGEETVQTAQRETIQRKPVGGTSGTPTTLPNVGNTRVRSGAPESQQPSWMKKLEPIVPGISDPGARAQLSREHKDVIEQMKKGTISADDPRVGFLKEISDADLRKYGIEKTDQGYKASSVQVSREEIETARKSTISGNSNQEIIMKSFASELRKKGVPEANIPYAVAALGGQVQQESGFNPRAEHDRGTGYGIYGARDPKPGQGRRTDMFKWLEQNGYARDSAEGQARYMVHEAFSGQYSATRKALLSANKDNIGQVTAVLVNDFEKPQERRQNIIDRTQNSNNLLGQALRISSNVDVSSNMTDEQIAQTIREKKEKERESGLAEAVTAKYKLPEGIDPKFAEQYDRLSPGQKQKVQEAIQKLGEGNVQAGTQKFNELYRANPQQTVERVSQGTPGGTLNLEENVSRNVHREMGINLTGGAGRRGYASSLNSMNPELMGRYHKAIQQLPEELRAKLKITSAFRDPNDPDIQRLYQQWLAGPRDKPMAHPRRSPHGRGMAFDIQLNHLSKEERAAVERAFRQNGLTDPVRKERFRDSHTHIELDPNYRGEPAGPAFRQRMNELTEKHRKTLQEQQGATSAIPTARAESNPTIVSPAATAPAPPAQAPQQKPVGNQEGTSTALPALTPQQKTQPQQQQQTPPQQQTQPQQQQQPRSSLPSITPQQQQQTPPQQQTQPQQQQQTQPQQQQKTQPQQQQQTPPQQQTQPQQQQQTPPQQSATATPEKKEEPVPQQAFALGGETEAQGPLTAYAIDKDKMRRDDTIVTDGRVRFTMNSEKESMKYDPDTGQVKIDQARGEARQKINANDLQPVEKQQEQSPTPQQEQQVIQNQATQVQSAPQQLPNSYDTTLDLTSDIFKTSSFKRAVAQSRFMKDNDPLGGHYDFGAYNIT